MKRSTPKVSRRGIRLFYQLVAMGFFSRSEATKVIHRIFIAHSKGKIQ